MKIDDFKFNDKVPSPFFLDRLFLYSKFTDIDHNVSIKRLVMSVSAALVGSGGLRLQGSYPFTFTAQDVLDDKRPIENILESRRDVTKVSINGADIENKVVSEFSLSGHPSMEVLELNGFSSLETVRLARLPRLAELSMQQNPQLKSFTVSEVPGLRDFSVVNCRQFSTAMLQGVLEAASSLESLSLTVFNVDGELRIANLVHFKELCLVNCFGIRKIVLLNLPRLETVHIPGANPEIVFEGSTPKIHIRTHEDEPSVAVFDDAEEAITLKVEEHTEPPTNQSSKPSPQKEKCILL